MNEKDLKKLLETKDFLEEKLGFYKQNKIIIETDSKHEMKGHFEKARHNLSFLKEIKQEYHDWMLVACYYAAYHAALALIISKGCFSKNHDATLCILIKEFYKQELTKEDIELLNMFDAQDILFYVESKQKREEASYSTKIKFDVKEVNNLKLKTTLFINKVDKIINSGPSQI